MTTAQFDGMLKNPTTTGAQPTLVQVTDLRNLFHFVKINQKKTKNPLVQTFFADCIALRYGVDRDRLGVSRNADAEPGVIIAPLDRLAGGVKETPYWFSMT
jgi:hypothetical protein